MFKDLFSKTQDNLQRIYEGRPKSKFPARPTSYYRPTIYCVKQLQVHDSGMTSHDAYTSGTSEFSE